MAKKLSGKQNNVYLSKLHVESIKGLEDIEIEFEEFGVTCITGANGTGKSTILYLLANAFHQSINWHSIEEWHSINPFLHEYRPNKRYYFSNFFVTTNNNNWTGSKLKYFYSDYVGHGTHSLDINRQGINRIRWMSRYPSRQKRAIFYTGLDYLATETEIDRYQAPYNLNSIEPPKHFSDSMKYDVLKQAGKIIGKKYNDLFFYKKRGKVKNFIGVEEADAGHYTSYDMGAGERKIFYLLIWLSMLPDRSLALIDEPEALLYDEATKELFNFFIDLSRKKQLQIICTTHWVGIKELRGKINSITFSRESGKIISYKGIDASTFELMHGRDKRPLLFVEDEVAECIVHKILKEENKQSEFQVDVFGSETRIPDYTACLIKCGDKKFTIISDGDTKIDWKRGIDGHKEITEEKLQAHFTSFSPDDKMSPEDMLVKYSRGGVEEIISNFIEQRPHKSEKEILNNISYNCNIKKAVLVEEMVNAFIKNHPNEWQRYTENIRKRLREVL